MFAARLVAGVALCFEMLAGQHKVGEIVVEGVLIELHDVRIASFVIRMASRAVGVLRIRVSPVIAMSCIDIRGDILMTVEAKGALVRTSECQVTMTALGLVLGVTFDDIARHHQRLDLGDCILCGKTHRHQRKSG